MALRRLAIIPARSGSKGVPGKNLREIGGRSLLARAVEVGLETDIRRLTSSGRESVVAALGGFVVPFALGYLMCRYLFGQELLLSLFVGAP